MPITCEWYDEARNIIIVSFQGTCTIDEVSDAEVGCTELYQQAQGRYDIIVDLSRATYAPPVGSLWYWKQQAELQHMTSPNWGLRVFAPATPVFSAYFEEVVNQSKAIRLHCRVCNSIEDAVALISKDRQLTQT